MNKEAKNIRPPVVVVLGHIDHGKTTLIEFLKKQNLTQKETGGITQHIGAHEILHQGKKLTILDTPGHEAFSKIRSRGAQAADTAILVVAADEGAKAQTKEAFLQIKAVNIPLLVAINKIDKPEADIDRTKRSLADNEILLEGWGGNIPSVNISAKAGKGVDELLDLVLLTYELNPKFTDPAEPGQGLVIETYKDSRLGNIISIIVLEGTLKINDYFISESASGKIKMIKDQNGKNINSVSASSPVLIFGIKEMPKVGEQFLSSPKNNTEEIKKTLTAQKKEPTKTQITSQKPGAKYKLIIRADAIGSLEAIQELLKNEPDFSIFQAKVGDITDEDIKMAKATGAIIISFRTKTPKGLKLLALDYKIPIVESELIYELKDKISQVLQKEIKKSAEPAEVEVLATFSKSPSKQTVGGKVLKGELKVNDNIEIQRNSEKIARGKIISLKITKTKVERAETGQEAGLEVKTSVEIQKGDVIRVIVNI